MNNYLVYFEIYGKKLKTTVEAIDESDAKSIVAEKIIFHKIVPIETNEHDNDDYGDAFNKMFGSDETLNNLMDMLGISKDKNKKT